MDEYRRTQRRPVEAPVAVVDTIAEQVVGRLGNLSETGMLLVGQVDLVDDALYQLRFDLPAPAPATVELGAHLLWVSEPGGGGMRWAGLRFINVPPAHAQALRAWLQAGGMGEAASG